MRRFALLCLGLVILGASCSSRGGTTTGPMTTTTSPAPPWQLELLVAHDGGIDLIAGGVTTPVLEGLPIAIALPDLSGGVVFQEPGGDIWPPHVVPIEWIRDLGDEPVELVHGGADRITPLQVVRVGGRHQLLYRRLTVLDEDDAREDLILHDLASGEERMLGVLMLYDESDFTAVHVAAGAVVVSWLEYAEEGGDHRLVDLDDLLGLGPERLIADLRMDGTPLLDPDRGCGFGVPCGLNEDAWGVFVALSPDATSAAVDYRVGGGAALEIVMIDVASRSESWRAPIPFTDGEWVTRVDHNGSDALVDIAGADGSRRYVVVATHGSHVESGPGTASFWRSEPGL